MDEAVLRRELGDRLARLRLERSLSQARLALLAGCTHSTIGRLERGERLPGYGHLLRIACALGLDERGLRYLLEDIRYRREVLDQLREIGRRDRGLAALLVTMLADVALDREARRQLARALLALRKDLQARAAGPAA